jgi:glutathione synthase/RimK-type ligase-like ATP-grasp enzyme
VLLLLFMIMVLCVTHSNDFYTIDIVQQHLQKLGISSFRMNTDEFAIRYRLQYNTRDCCLVTNGQTIHASQISAIWYRKLWALQTPLDLDPAYRNTFVREYETYRNLFFQALRQLPWINSMEADHAAGHNKLLQLYTAEAVGLTIPPTIFTNDQAAANNFFDVCGGDIIVKLHSALSKSMRGDGLFFPTTRLTVQDLESLDMLPYCPMIFQQYIPKAYELRIVYIEGTFFTGKIHSGNQTDWRTMAGSTSPWLPYILPVHEQEKLDALMRRLQLSFGAIDMIRQPDGEYVFLEVNPQGEWGMLQKHLNYPIGETIAEKLKMRINNG